MPTYTAEDLSYAIEHYGILGMKWGVRNAESQRKLGPSKRDNELSNSRARSKPASKASIKASNKARRIEAKTMTDAELNEIINRINLEKRYLEATTIKTSKSAIRKEVEKILANALRQTAQKYVTAAMGVGVDQILKSAGVDVKKLNSKAPKNKKSS